MINETTFFAYIRKAPFGGRLTQAQVDGVDSILSAFRSGGYSDPRHCAYILATAFHETGGRMEPVREGFASTDAKARKIIAARPYGVPDMASNGRKYSDTGHVFYGRGFVQLTWANNYDAMGSILDIDLLNNPDLALDPGISARILVEGMCRGVSAKGDFTGKAVEDYFNDRVNDPVGARRVVNGTDKAQLIASYYKAFYDALEAAKAEEPQPADVKPEDAKPDAPALATDKTTLGGVAAAVGASGASGLLSAVNNPWALGAVALLTLVAAVGAYLFFTGRLEIRRKAGA